MLPYCNLSWSIDSHSYPSRDEARLVQLSALCHPALGHFNDDASRFPVPLYAPVVIRQNFG